MTPSIEAAFAERFGQDQADAIKSAAEEHKNGVHDDPGSDPFKWALCIAIGHECVGRFAGYHGISVAEDDLRAWCWDHADLASHDGDVDYLSALCGAYEGWVRTDA